jgi:large subunit ribosomal protein L19
MSYQVLLSSSVVTGQLRQDIPEFAVGSIIIVYYKIFEGEKQRVQAYKGIVTNRKGGNGLDATFTVSKNSFGAVKVERTFPLHSPSIDRIEVEILQRARRANINNLALKVKDISKSLRSKPVKAKVSS